MKYYNYPLAVYCVASTCRNNKSGDTEAIINYDGSETISLTSATGGGGAELTAMKKGALAFDEKEYLSITSSPSDVLLPGDRDYQNPTYGTSEFIITDPKGDRTLSDPLYATVEPTSGSSDDIPEKVMPSPDDFAPPNTKPHIATTTILSTVVSTEFGKYNPAKPVPMDVQNEPQYATVKPKGKQATARPFAADEEWDDDELSQEV